MTLHYLVLVTRTPHFTQEAAAEHVRFLDALRANNQLLITGSFTDKTGGAYVLQNVVDPAAAQAIADADPLITLGSATATVHEWATR